MQNNWWPEKYRPKTISDYVGNPTFVEKMELWLKNGEIPHLLLYSEKSGTGKTSAAKLIADALDADVMYINASNENSIDIVREKITSFVSVIGFNKWKIVICDEFSYFSLNAQSALNSILETYSKNCRFIFTANYIEKILPSIVSRCAAFEISTPPKVEILKRMCGILKQENIQYTEKEVAQVIKDFYPDQRIMINYLQDNSQTGTLKIPADNIVINDYCKLILAELTNTKQPVKTMFVNIRQIMADSKVRDFTDLYKHLYRKLDDYTIDGQKGLVILAIADGQYKDAFVVDKEINAMATITNIINIIKA